MSEKINDQQIHNEALKLLDIDKLLDAFYENNKALQQTKLELKLANRQIAYLENKIKNLEDSINYYTAQKNSESKHICQNCSNFFSDKFYCLEKNIVLHNITVSSCKCYDNRYKDAQLSLSFKKD